MLISLPWQVALTQTQTHWNMWHNTYRWTEGLREINSKEGSDLVLILLLGCSEVASGTLWGNQGNWHRVGRSALSHRLVKIKPEKEADVEVETGEQREINLSQTSYTSITSMCKQKYSINRQTQSADWARPLAASHILSSLKHQPSVHPGRTWCDLGGRWIRGCWIRITLRWAGHKL